MTLLLLLHLRAELWSGADLAPIPLPQKVSRLNVLVVRWRVPCLALLELTCNTISFKHACTSPFSPSLSFPFTVAGGRCQLRQVLPDPHPVGAAEHRRL